MFAVCEVTILPAVGACLLESERKRDADLVCDCTKYLSIASRGVYRSVCVLPATVSSFYMLTLQSPQRSSATLLLSHQDRNRKSHFLLHHVNNHSGEERAPGFTVRWRFCDALANVWLRNLGACHLCGCYFDMCHLSKHCC